MPHSTPLIATIVAGLGLAFLLGALAHRLRLPTLVGYLLAGLLVGPHTPGFVADQALSQELAELGVILLMFGVGLHFSLKDLLSVKAIAVPGAVVQIAVATALGASLAWMLGWTIGAGLVFGLALSVASTVVLLRAMQERRLVETERGRIAVGWLIVEDLAMVLALVLLPPVAALIGGPGTDVPTTAATTLSDSVAGVLGITFAKIAAFVALMLIVGRRLIPWVLHEVAHSGSRELFRLAVLAIALGVAFGAAKLFGVSLALGAFFAGMIMSESPLSHQAARETLPLRDAFSVLFFVAVGMMFNPLSLLAEPLPILATLFIIMIGKSLAAFLIVRGFRHPAGTALTISASLAQIGEFSFILAELGVQLGMLPAQGRNLILAGALLSIVLNPLAFAAADWLRRRMEGEHVSARQGTAPPSAVAAEQEGAPGRTDLTDHIVLVGYGRVGSLVGDALRQSDRRFLVIEDAETALSRLRAAGIETITGNAAATEILAAANPGQARQLVITIPDAFEAGQVVEQARRANAGLDIIAQGHSEDEAGHLRQLGAHVVITGEREIARAIVAEIERRLGGPAANAAPA